MKNNYEFHLKVVDKKYLYYTLRYRLRDKNDKGLPETIVLTGKTKEDIYKKIDEIEGKGKNRNMREFLPLTLEELTNYYLEEIIKTTRSKSTHKTYKMYYNSYIKNYFGNSKLSDITSDNVQRFINYMIQDKGLSNNYILNIIMFLKSVLDIATKKGIYYSNPCEIAIKKPRRTQRSATPLTKEELKKFLELAKGNSKYYYVYLVSIYLGTRRGETLGLSWDDYDEYSKTIRVHQQVQDNPDGDVEKVIITEHTKNYSDECIPVPDDCVKLFALIRKKQIIEKERSGYNNKYNLIFTNNNGNPIPPNCVTRDFREICNAIGIKHRLHDLRHTCATAIFEATGDLVHVQHALRDIDPRAASIYVKPSELMQKENAESISNYVNSIIQMGDNVLDNISV